jgi:hypothetical protein
MPHHRHCFLMVPHFVSSASHVVHSSLAPGERQITSRHAFGVFVRVDELPEVTAMLEIIHFKIREEEPQHRIKFPDDYPLVGSRVEARILSWSLSPKDVRLTQLSHLDWSHTRWLASHNA